MDQSLLTILHLMKGKLQDLISSSSRVQQALDDITVESLAIIQEAEIICSKLQTILNRLSSELTNYLKLSNEPDPDEISEISSTQLEAEELLCELKVKIKIKTKFIETTQPSEKSTEVHLNSRLPKLELPEFDGDILKWSTFWDQFRSNIDKRNLADVDKLLYLKASLTGDAKGILEGLEITNKNYQIALTSLKNRYGKESHVIDAHYAALYRVKSTSVMDIVEIRNTFNEIERHLRVLQSLGEDINHTHLRFMIMEKFPEEIVYEIKLKANTESIEGIRKNLENLIAAREDAARLMAKREEERYTTQSLHVTAVKAEKEKEVLGTMKARTNSPIVKTEPNMQKQERGSTSNQKRGLKSTFKRKFTRVNQNREQRYTKKRKISCIFCTGDHFDDQCRKFSSVFERKSQLRNKCYNCLAEGHQLAKCLNKICCYHCKKSGEHHRSLCPRKFNRKSETSNTMMQINNRSKTILQTAIVRIKHQGSNSTREKCRALLDSGSQRTYITQTMANKLKLPIEEEVKLSVFTFGAKSPQIIDSPLVKLNILTLTNKTISLYAHVVPHIAQCVPHNDVELGEHENSIILADDGSLSSKIDMLIGNDYYHSIMNAEKVKIKENLYLVDSKLGWILSGEVTADEENQLSVITYFQSCGEIKLNKPDLPLDNGSIQVLWNLEAIGITDSPHTTADEEAIKRFNESTQVIDNRYTVSWPWIEYTYKLPTNFGLSLGRLTSLLKRLDQHTLTEYDNIFKEQLREGIIELVESPNESLNHPVHYLPHHCIRPKDKPIRIVYDASSKTKDNQSLNECLYRGPMMLEDLTGLLIKFRCYPIALSADVEKAFLQIALHKEDRDVTRFLWIKDLTKLPTEQNLICMRFCRVPFGIISSPFLLNATVKYHLSKNSKPEIRDLSNNIYVDNLVTGTSSTKQALQLYNNAKDTFQEMSMNLRDWNSNSKEFMSQISDTSREKYIKILGLNWNLEEDNLHLRFKFNANAISKRGVLKTIASVYDPCGFAVPQVLQAKLFLQELWGKKTKWDEKLSKNMEEKWLTIQEQLKEVEKIVIHRHYISELNQEDDKNNYQIHCFTDASLKAYAAAIYLTNGKKITFIIGKSRLVPIKDQEDLKIPRLELLGVVIGSRLIKFVLKFISVKITRQVLWTDSQIVIDWYNSSKLLPPFVARRIQEIKQNNQLIIRYVPSKLNPADVATKPSSPENIITWIVGPKFLLKDHEITADSEICMTSLLRGEGLTKKSGEDKTERKEIASTKRDEQIDDSNIQTIKISGKEEDNSDGIIKATENLNLEKIKDLQKEYFKEELSGKATQLSHNLRLFLDIDGILRCQGRMRNANWSFDKRYPILLPKESELTRKIITKTHEENYHVGANHTLSIIRETYWIPQGKRQVQKLIRKCPTCVKHGGGPYRLPPTPALPPERVNFSSPFTFTGMDYLGPILVKKGKSTEKRWICLFTCLAVRAIHLEVVHDLSAEEGLRALRRMIATRGIPTLITSDNASQFKLMAEILNQSYCITKRIQWRFIPALAPWFGGFYERLIGIVKHCMKRTLQKHLLEDGEFSTVMKEMEATVNTRPLTYVDTELEHILKPSDFLTVGKCIKLEANQREVLTEGTITKQDLVKGWRKALKVQKEFREMFSNRYLSSLRERYWHSHKEPRVVSQREPNEGQIVQIKGDSHNRESWRIGKIVELISGKDGHVRTAKVRVDNKDFIRSISHLYPLEMDKVNPTHRTEEVKARFHIPIGSPIKGHATDTTPQEENEFQEVEIDLLDKKPEEITEVIKDNKQENDPASDAIQRENDNKVPEEETRTRRVAAVRALDKIKEWTQALVTIFC